MKQSEKIKNTDILDEPYEVKSYIEEMKPDFARVRHRERYSMLKYCKLNFPNDRMFLKDGYKCDFCPSISSQDHLIYRCPQYDFLRRNRRMTEEKDRLQFLVDVIKHRLEQDHDPED